MQKAIATIIEQAEKEGMIQETDLNAQLEKLQLTSEEIA